MDIKTAAYRKARRVETIKAEMKKLGQELDAINTWAIEVLDPEYEEEHQQGTVKLVNNFARGNTAFRPAAFRAFELVWEEFK